MTCVTPCRRRLLFIKKRFVRLVKSVQFPGVRSLPDGVWIQTGKVVIVQMIFDRRRTFKRPVGRPVDRPVGCVRTRS